MIFASVASISVKYYKTAESYEDTLHLENNLGILLPAIILFLSLPNFYAYS